MLMVLLTVQIFPVLYGTQTFITSLIRPLHWSFSWSSWILSKLSACFFKTHLCLCLQSGLSIYVSVTGKLCAFIMFLCMLHMYVILSSVLLHSSLNAGAGIQGTVAKKKTDEMILNSCKLTFQVNKINIHASM